MAGVRARGLAELPAAHRVLDGQGMKLAALVLPLGLFAACATDPDTGVTDDVVDGKADGAGRFTPSFCGVNILEAAGPEFVGEVCIGVNRSDTDELTQALRVEYTDDRTEIYTLTPSEAPADNDPNTERLTAKRGARGQEHDLILILEADSDLPKSIAGSVDRGASFVVPLAQHAPKVTCFMSRISGVPGGYARVQETLQLGSTDNYAQANPLDAWEGSYGFTLYGSDEPTEFEVLLQENNHVQDETGSFSCSLEDVVPGQAFCKEAIKVDKNLGTELGEEEENIVHAFNFWCHVAQ